MPDGFVIVGDAACAFNPVYGQRMSAAALTAEAFDRCLAAQLAGHGTVTGVSALTVLGRRHDAPESDISPAPRPLVPVKEPA